MNREMSTIKEKEVIWEEINLIEPKMKLETNGGSDACDIITNTKDSKENVLLSGITKKKKISGIYKIINRVNRKYYVGSTDDITRRWYRNIRWNSYGV